MTINSIIKLTISLAVIATTAYTKSFLRARPNAPLYGSYFGDAVGLSWFRRTVDGVSTLGHGGSMRGQYSWLPMVPDKDFATVTLATAEPSGIQFNQDVVRWALEEQLGLVDRDPEPIAFDEHRARELVGTYEEKSGRVTISAPYRRLVLNFEVIAEALPHLGDEAPEFPPSKSGLIAGAGDQYIFTSGPFTGMRGIFSRNASGGIESVDLAGRAYRRLGRNE